MTRSYQGRLRLEVSVPEQPELASYFKAFVEFPIGCPQCGLEQGKIKKNGFDSHHSDRPQLFYCNRCQKSFYAHTSWLFVQLANIEWERILNSLFQDRLRPKAVALRHEIPSCLLAKIIHQCQDAVDQRIAEINRKRPELAPLPVPLDDAIWWDEMFFRLGTISWCLILLVDARGRPLMWKFTKKRTKEEYLEVLQHLWHELPTVPIFVGDGWTTYPKVCKELGRECFLIQHLHTKPWQDVRIHHFRPDEKGQMITQTSLEIPYDAFIRNWPVNGVTMERDHRLSPPKQDKKTRGRPKGSKDKKKRRAWGTKTPRSEKGKPKKRGAKSIAQHGRTVQFHPTPLNGGWHIKWTSPPTQHEQTRDPTKESVELLLDITYKVMQGKTVQSNRIEGVNREIRTIIPDRGLKTPTQTQRYLNYHLKVWQGTTQSTSQESSIDNPITSSRAFKRLNAFLKTSSNTSKVETRLMHQPRF